VHLVGFIIRKELKVVIMRSLINEHAYCALGNDILQTDRYQYRREVYYLRKFNRDGEGSRLTSLKCWHHIGLPDYVVF